ncbi:MAG: hypothetical protein Ct9H90mP26_1830 [Methanobacteriota archaeon]|nr:MAG: hypothetical protein Ct9H90mP26_1830 [Euryarchaeota archaeon]
MFFLELLSCRLTMQRSSRDLGLNSEWKLQRHGYSGAFIRNRFIPGIYVVAGFSFGLLVSAGGWIMASEEITVGQFVPSY